MSGHTPKRPEWFWKWVLRHAGYEDPDSVMRWYAGEGDLRTDTLPVKDKSESVRFVSDAFYDLGGSNEEENRSNSI